MSLYLGSKKVENVTAQITLPVEPSDDLPLADGTASAGVSKKFSRADHVHPMETVEATLVDLPSAEELGAIPAPASGTTGQVLTKTADGQEWKNVPVDENSILLDDTNIKLPLSSQCNAITYGDGKFVAVSNGSTATYSVNGINWTETTLPSTANRRSIAYGNGKFVAVDYSGNVTYSTNGINWTEVTPSVSGMFDSVTYGGGKFVAISLTDNLIIYSTDGINWIEVTTTTVRSGRFFSVTYGNGKFIAVSGAGSTAAYSTDAINWTRATDSSAGSWLNVTYGDGKFVAIGNSSTAIYSTDGNNWTTTTLPLDVPWCSIVYGNDKFVAVNRTNNTAIYSTDAINWTKVTMPLNMGWEAITYGEGKFIAISESDSNNAVAYSTDGINWLFTKKVLSYPDGTDIHEQVRTTLQIPEPESEVFTCNITQSDSTYTCDKTYAEILEAYNAGKVCIAKNNQHSYYLASVSVQIITFINIEDKKSCQFFIRSDNTVDYSETTLATPPNARKVTLTTSGWSNNQQAVTCIGVSASATNQEIRVMPADASKTSAYVSCGISCIAQARRKLTFACDTVPTTAIDVYVVMQSLNFLT